MNRDYRLLKLYHEHLTRQELLTLKGQLKAGDVDGFKKGLFKILKAKKCITIRKQTH